jgi:hypothetical protein
VCSQMTPLSSRSPSPRRWCGLSYALKSWIRRRGRMAFLVDSMWLASTSLSRRAWRPSRPCGSVTARASCGQLGIGFSPVES